MKRRDVLNVAAFTAAARLLGIQPAPATAEPTPETTTIRLVQMPDICDGTPL